MHKNRKASRRDRWVERSDLEPGLLALQNVDRRNITWFENTSSVVITSVRSKLNEASIRTIQLRKNTSPSADSSTSPLQPSSRSDERNIVTNYCLCLKY